MITFLAKHDLLVQQLAWTLLHTLWQGVAIALLLAIVLRAMRNASSKARYLIACGAMSLLVISAIVTFALLAQPPVAATPRLARAPDAPTPLTATHVVASHQSLDLPQARTDPLRYIVTAWIAGVTAMALWHVGGWLMLLRLRRGEPVERLRGVLDRLAAQTGVTRAVRVLEAARVDVPAVLGVLRPVILVPVALLNELAPQQVEAILAHELAHIRRHDFLVNLIQSAIETLLFYHPATWWISAQIRRERENCCDDIATKICGDDRAYAAALAALEQRRLPAASLHLVPSATGGDLLDRVRRVLKLPPLRRRHSRTRSLAAAGLALACIVLPLVVAAGEKPAMDANTAAAPATQAYRFVKVIVGKDDLRHDGTAMTVGALQKLFAAIPESQRRQTVLEVAAASPDVTVERFFTATAAMHQIVAQQKLAYLSHVGIERATTAPTTAPSTRAAAAAARGEYYIAGMIARGGVYAVAPKRPITLKQAIAAAGGPTAKPETLLVTVVRREGDTEHFALENAPLGDILSGRIDLVAQGNDIIRITDKPVNVNAEAAANAAIIPADADAKPTGEYYIDGIVQRTGVYSLTARKITLKQAIAAAGGFDDGKTDALLTIVRRSGADRESKPVADVRYSEIVSGAKRDAYLQPNDVIQVRDAPPVAAPAAPATQPRAAGDPGAELNDPRLLQLLHSRNSVALQIESVLSNLGREHPRMKSARAMLAQLDRQIADTRAAAAKAPVEQIATVDATMREYVHTLESMEFNLQRLARTMGPKSRVYIDAQRDIELQKQRIAAYAAEYRRQFDPDSMLDTRHRVIPVQPSPATQP